MTHGELLALYRDAIPLDNISDPDILKQFRGVTFMDRSSVFISPPKEKLWCRITIGKGSVIGPHVCLLGDIEIGEHTIIGPGLELINVSIGNRCVIGRAPITDTAIGNDVIIGKFAEIKRSTIDDNVHAVHASYLGDADVLEGANIAYGTTTANYDGTPIKNKTIFGAHVKTGIHSLFVSSKGEKQDIPGLLVVGEDAVIGAGAIVLTDVPPGATIIGIHKKQKNEGGS